MCTTMVNALDLKIKCKSLIIQVAYGCEAVSNIVSTQQTSNEAHTNCLNYKSELTKITAPFASNKIQYV